MRTVHFLKIWMVLLLGITSRPVWAESFRNYLDGAGGFQVGLIGREEPAAFGGELTVFGFMTPFVSPYGGLSFLVTEELERNL